MAIVNILAFVTAALLIAFFCRECLVSVLPMTACGLVFLLYLLALAGHLSWIDGIDAGFLALTALWLVLGKRKEVVQGCLQKLREPSFVAGMLLLAAVAVCVSAKTVTWWDDVNFWATDVKSLYYLDGFAGKYGNVAPEFGDYPPGAQLFKWWFLHFDRNSFREGLAFAGYHVLNLLFLLPLFKRISGKNVIIWIGAGLTLWLFPGIAEVYGYQGFCADLTMACIYGNFLFAVTDREGHAAPFYYGRLASYLGLLVIVKSVGFIWALFGIIFWLLYTWKDEREKKSGRLLRMGSVVLAPALTGGSWMVFCLLMRRVTKTTTTAVKYVTTDEYGLSGYMADFARAFAKAFFTEPLHKERSFAVDLTPFAFYLLICALVLFFAWKGKMAFPGSRRILWFSVVSGALFYAIIFLAHITIFATETQYLEASGMISSIERYGAPFTVGTLLFLSLVWMEHGGVLFAQRGRFLAEYGTILCLIVLVAVTTQWQAAYDGLLGYRGDAQKNDSQRAEMLDESSRSFLETLGQIPEGTSTRVLCIQKETGSRWVRNSYTNLEASPVSVVYKGVDLNDATDFWLAGEITASHAQYLYVESQEAEMEPLFGGMLREKETAFEAGTLYRIAEKDGAVQLYKVKENGR